MQRRPGGTQGCSIGTIRRTAEPNSNPPPTSRRVPLYTAAFRGLPGSPAERSVHESPPSVVTHTSPPPKSPPKTAITVFESLGSTAVALPDNGACGGVLSIQVTPPSVERITLTGWEPRASATPTQRIEGSAGSIATSNTWSLAPIPRFSVTQLRPLSVLFRILSWVPR